MADDSVSPAMFDASGRWMRSLLDGEILPVGELGFLWKGRDKLGSPVGAGIVLVRLADSGGVVRVGKVPAVR